MPTTARRQRKYPGRMRWDECADRLGGLATMVEVGVWRGGNASRLLEMVPGLYMFLVDAWQAPTPGSSFAESGAEQAKHGQNVYDAVYAQCMGRVRGYQHRCTVLRMSSIEAADRVADRSVDLVFIDADHSYRGVSSDIRAWRSKVRPGGWIGGHDYNHPRYPGVVTAVVEAFPTFATVGADHTWWHRIE